MNTINSKIKQYHGKVFSIGIKYLFRKIGINYEVYYLLTNSTDYEKTKRRIQNYSYNDIKELTYNDFKTGDNTTFDEKKLSLIDPRFKSKKYWSFGIINDCRLIASGWI